MGVQLLELRSVQGVVDCAYVVSATVLANSQLVCLSWHAMPLCTAFLEPIPFYAAASLG